MQLFIWSFGHLLIGLEQLTQRSLGGIENPRHSLSPIHMDPDYCSNPLVIFERILAFTTVAYTNNTHFKFLHMCVVFAKEYVYTLMCVKVDMFML